MMILRAYTKLSNFKRRVLELIFLFFISLIIFSFTNDWKIVVFFMTGFIWNWAAHQKVGYVFEKSKYKLSFLKMVYNLHYLFQYPFKKWHPVFAFFARTLPCGLFLMGLNHFFSSHLIVFSSFLGSFVFELFQFDAFFNIQDKNI